MAMILTPKNGYIIVTEIPDTEREVGGIILLASSTDEEQLAKGLIVSSDTKEYKKGEKILYNKALPLDVTIQEGGKDSKYWFVQDKDVVAIFD